MKNKQETSIFICLSVVLLIICIALFTDEIIFTKNTFSQTYKPQTSIEKGLKVENSCNLFSGKDFKSNNLLHNLSNDMLNRNMSAIDNSSIDNSDFPVGIKTQHIENSTQNWTIVGSKTGTYVVADYRNTQMNRYSASGNGLENYGRENATVYTTDKSVQQHDNVPSLQLPVGFAAKSGGDKSQSNNSNYTSNSSVNHGFMSMTTNMASLESTTGEAEFGPQRGPNPDDGDGDLTPIPVGDGYWLLMLMMIGYAAVKMGKMHRVN